MLLKSSIHSREFPKTKNIIPFLKIRSLILSVPPFAVSVPKCFRDSRESRNRIFRQWKHKLHKLKKNRLISNRVDFRIEVDVELHPDLAASCESKISSLTINYLPKIGTIKIIMVEATENIKIAVVFLLLLFKYGLIYILDQFQNDNHNNNFI